MGVTIKEIAELTGVSTAAVSMAINNKPGVSGETREMIIRVAREKGFVPKQYTTRKKASGKKPIRFLVCINDDIIPNNYNESPFFMSLIHDIEKACSERGYALLISSTNLSNLEENISKYEEQHPSSGLILLGTNVTAEDVLILKKHQPNIVVIDNVFDYINVTCVGANSLMSGYNAASYILNHAFQRIGYVQAKMRLYNLEQCNKGFNKKLNDSGMSLTADYIYSITNSIEGSYRDFKEILNNKRDLPEVLFCEDDYMAIGVMRALLENQIKIPGEVSVIGVDNIILSSNTSPTLTTIQVDTQVMASLSVQRIIEYIKNDKIYTFKIIVDTVLIERESCR